MSDSSAPSQAAEQVIGIFYPHRELIPKCLDYEIKTEMKDRFRALQILKNRYGRSDLAIGVGFYGEIGYWKELPRAEDIYDYTMYNTINGQAQNSTSDGEICTDLKKEKWRTRMQA